MFLVVQIYENNNFICLFTINYRDAQLIYGEKVYKCLFFNNHVYGFRQVVIIFTHSVGINANITISKKQMFNNLLPVFNTAHFLKKNHRES